jgi:hypothetical protein
MESLQSIYEWYKRMIIPKDHKFVYEYDPTTDTTRYEECPIRQIASSEYIMIRLRAEVLSIKFGILEF